MWGRRGKSAKLTDIRSKAMPTVPCTHKMVQQMDGPTNCHTTMHLARLKPSPHLEVLVHHRDLWVALAEMGEQGAVCTRLRPNFHCLTGGAVFLGDRLVRQ